jgi:hypothetical protein
VRPRGSRPAARNRAHRIPTLAARVTETLGATAAAYSPSNAARPSQRSRGRQGSVPNRTCTRAATIPTCKPLTASTCDVPQRHSAKASLGATGVSADCPSRKHAANAPGSPPIPCAIQARARRPPPSPEPRTARHPRPPPSDACSPMRCETWPRTGDPVAPQALARRMARSSAAPGAHDPRADRSSTNPSKALPAQAAVRSSSPAAWGSTIRSGRGRIRVVSAPAGRTLSAARTSRPPSTARSPRTQASPAQASPRASCSSAKRVRSAPRATPARSRPLRISTSPSRSPAPDPPRQARRTAQRPAIVAAPPAQWDTGSQAVLVRSPRTRPATRTQAHRAAVGIRGWRRWMVTPEHRSNRGAGGKGTRPRSVAVGSWTGDGG